MAGAQIFGNNDGTTLAAALAPGDVSATVVDGSVFPNPNSGGAYIALTLQSGEDIEIIHCTNVSANVCTISRGEEGTTPLLFAPGAVIELRITAAALSTIPQGLDNSYQVRGLRAIAIQSYRTVTTRTATGQDAIALGIDNISSNTEAISIGAYGSATGLYSISIGSAANATNENAIAIGVQVATAGWAGVAIGQWAVASGSYTIALGWYPNVQGWSDIGMGSNVTTKTPDTYVISTYHETNDVVRPTTPNGYAYMTEASGTTGGTEPTWPTVLGNTVVDNGVTWICIPDILNYDYNLAIGYRASAYSGGVAIGAWASVTRDSSVAIGTKAYARDDASVAIGLNSHSSAYTAISIGYLAVSSGWAAISIGSLSNALDVRGIAIGRIAIATGWADIAIGSEALTEVPVTYGVSTAYQQRAVITPTTPNGKQYFAQNSGTSSSSEPTWTTTVGATFVDNDITWECIDAVSVSDSNIAVGYLAQAYGTAISIGQRAVALNAETIAIGTLSLASLNYAVAIGNNARAQGQDAICIGRASTSSDSTTIAIGYNNNISAVGSIGIGNGVVASTSQCIALGTSSLCDTASYAISIGYFSKSKGVGSLALGPWAEANQYGSVALGAEMKNNNPNTILSRGIPTVQRDIWWHGSESIFYNSGEQIIMTSACDLCGGTTWAASTSYPHGHIAKPTTPNGKQYFWWTSDKAPASTAGTEPTWPTTKNGWVASGGGYWVCIDPANIGFNLSAGYSPFNVTFYVSEVGFICENFNTVSVLPTISMGDAALATRHVSATLMTDITASLQKEKFVPADDVPGLTDFKAVIDTLGTGTEMVGRFYWKGIAVETTRQ